MLCPEPEIRSAVVQLYAHLAPALHPCSDASEASSPDDTRNVLLQRILEQAEDMDFQVRKVRAQKAAAVLIVSLSLMPCSTLD